VWITRFFHGILINIRKENITLISKITWKRLSFTLQHSFTSV